MLQRLRRRQRPRLPEHARTEVQNSSGRLHYDINNEAVKNGVPPPTGGDAQRPGVSYHFQPKKRTRTSTTGVGGRRSCLCWLLHSLKETHFALKTADLTKCTNFVVLNVCKSLQSFSHQPYRRARTFQSACRQFPLTTDELIHGVFY